MKTGPVEGFTACKIQLVDCIQPWWTDDRCAARCPEARTAMTWAVVCMRTNNKHDWSILGRAMSITLGVTPSVCKSRNRCGYISRDNWWSKVGTRLRNRAACACCALLWGACRCVCITTTSALRKVLGKTWMMQLCCSIACRCF